MAVIFVAMVAMTIGGLLATALSFIPQRDRCGAPTPTERQFNYSMCVLRGPHDGLHIAADGHRFK